jgi:tungstate transport system permease protein
MSSLASTITEGFQEALRLIFTLDPIVFDIVLRSLWISGMATLLASLWSIPLAMLLAMRRSRVSGIIITIFNGLIGMPTVGLGLILVLLFMRNGPLGFLHLYLSPAGIMVGQAILITPIIISFVVKALEDVDPGIRDLAKTLGASDAEASLKVLGEARIGALLAVVAGFNRAIAELGVASMVGGDQPSVTRVMTTAIQDEINFANYDLAIALAIILITLALALTFVVNIFGGRFRRS